MISDTILSVEPHLSKTQIPRDAQVRLIANKFDRDCQHLMVIGGPQTGKTDLLKQFAEHHAGYSIHVEIDDSPWTQQQHAFLYSICQQLSEIMGKSPLPVNIKTEELFTLFHQ